MGLSKVLVIGGTGGIGRQLVNASVKLGHPTFALVRSTSPSDPAKAELLKTFQDAGVTLLVGDLFDHASLVAALKQVEVVCSNIGGTQLGDQIRILDAAVEAGTIKRIVPSEYGNQLDRMDLKHPVLKIFDPKLQFRRAVEKSGVPFTFVVSYCFNSYFLSSLAQSNLFPTSAPPRDGKLLIYGDGTVKAIFNDEEDIATFTISSVDDPRVANKNLLIAPKGNIASQGEVIAIWEKKIGHTFEKEYLDEETVLKSLDELPFPQNFSRGLSYSLFVRGDATSFELDPAKEVEATSLYPEVKYTPIEQYFDRFL